MTYELLHGDCLTEMAAMDAGSVDAVCCDPPYGLEFMGKSWDRLDGGYNSARWSGKRTAAGLPSRDAASPAGRHAATVSPSKPNPKCGICGHYKFSSHPCRCESPDWVARKNEQSVRMQAWHQEWATEALRVLKPSHYLLAFGGTRTWHRLACAIEDAGLEIRDTLMWLYGQGFPKGKSCLKPSWEPVILARKPGPMRELGIEECRVASPNPVQSSASKGDPFGPGKYPLGEGRQYQSSGRWPANLVLECTCDETWEGTAKSNGWDVSGSKASENTSMSGPNYARGPKPGATIGKEPVRIHTDPNCPCAMLDGQTDGVIHGAGSAKTAEDWGDKSFKGYDASSYHLSMERQPHRLGDSGGASRFFYCPKASRSERNKGLPVGESSSHPTVKPVALMRWLVRLVAQPGDVVVDPFAGSGTTGVACAMEGREFIGIEQDAEYVEIARRRIEHASAQGRLPLDESPPLPPVAGRPT